MTIRCDVCGEKFNGVFILISIIVFMYGGGGFVSYFTKQFNLQLLGSLIGLLFGLVFVYSANRKHFDHVFRIRKVK